MVLELVNIFSAFYKCYFGNLLSLRAAHAYHLNTLLEQLLKDAGLSVDWKDTILPLVKTISAQVLIICIQCTL